jgi:hypothetical protein
VNEDISATDAAQEDQVNAVVEEGDESPREEVVTGRFQHAFDPGIFDVSQQDVAVALFESLRVAFEDVEEFLDDGLVDGIVVPDDDVAIPHISVDGDVVVF